MKNKNHLWSLLTFLMVGFLSLGFVSCGGSDDEDDPAPVPTPVPETTDLLAGISAEPAEELLMCRGYAYRVSCGLKTKYFYQKIYTQSDYNKMSEKEIIADVVTNKLEDREVPDDDNYWSWNLYENKTYVLAMIPYGEDDLQGKLYTKMIKTKSSDSEPKVGISNFSIDWTTDSYVWNVTKNTYCASYYTFAAASKTTFPTFIWMEEGAYALIGWAIRSEMKKDDSNHRTTINQSLLNDFGYSDYTVSEKFYASQINDGTSSLVANPLTDKYIQIVVWGTKSNGELSGYLTFGSVDLTSNSRRAVKSSIDYIMDESKNNELKCVRGNIKDIEIIRIH